MNEKEIAFILCVNDEIEYEECRFYLDRLIVPKDFITDVITVRDASSMASGYNAGMHSSNAKYKVYLHQDVFIKNRNFIGDMLRVFQTDKNIGLLGCIGTRSLGEDARAVTDWDTGKILHNCIPPLAEFPPEEGIFCRVQAVDGLLIATQYDVSWREDIFDGWDFYDISQCMEFMRAGYITAVPVQKEPWCYHDNSYSKMLKYNHYRNLFIQEYGEQGYFRMQEGSKEIQEYSEIKEQIRREIEMLLNYGKKDELREIFRNPENQGYLHLREAEAITRIDWLEEKNESTIRFWEDRADAKTLLYKLRFLKYTLKRIEYGADNMEDIIQRLKGNYSGYAIKEVCSRYVVYRDKVYGKLEKIQDKLYGSSKKI